MEISQFAPVFIPTLNRDVHLKRCVDSFARCTHADKTDLYIALDYPAKETHYEGYNKIKEFLKTIIAFKSVNIIERRENYGAEKNFNEGLTYIFRNYDRVIPSEDDNEFSPNFLDYINKGLERFKDDSNVLAICGHRPLIYISPNYEYNYYFAKGFSPWGFGLWREKNKLWLRTPEDLKRFVSNSTLKNSLKYYHERLYYDTLHYIKENKNMIGDGAIALHLIEYDKYCVYPTIAKSRNHGHDGSGVHCGKIQYDRYANQKIDENRTVEFSSNVPLQNELINSSLRKYSKVRFIEKVKMLIKKLLSIMGVKYR